MDKPITFNEWLGTQGNMVLLHANCCRIAFEGGQQSMQAKVEELEKQLSEYIFVAETIDEMYVKEVQKSDELQKRVDAAIKCADLNFWNANTVKAMVEALKGEG
ncbi:hypothetical protein [Acinetobacter baumannii]|uniref:hypothetical protein n=1 Tax=Acinetobacter baumannii TaxID=470 RepID=UPI00112A7587|nr:hypothetical protein [Acinetobacter baumannii]TPT86008.1 hypothetical protein FJU52_06205 [Acinetobacter baumannii]